MTSTAHLLRTKGDQSEMDAKIDAWFHGPKPRGKPSCPCGYVGGSRSIMAHRNSCPVWLRYVELLLQ